MLTRAVAVLVWVTVVASTSLAAVPAAQAGAAPAPPVIGSLATTSGPVGGGTRVVIRGARLKPVTAVRFDGARGTSFVRLSARRIAVTTPRHAAGAADVRLLVGRKVVAIARNAFTFTSVGPPRITRLVPAQGSTTGTTVLAVDGSRLRAAEVYFGDRRATIQRRVSDQRLLVRAPRHAAGSVQVTVRTGGRTSRPALFTYRPPPSITTLSPDTGPPRGGDVVTLTGSGLDTVARVDFGDKAGSHLQHLSPTTLRVTTPRVTEEGPVEVVGTGPLGRTDEIRPAPTYWYEPPGLGGLYWTDAQDWPGFGHGSPAGISCPTTTFCAAVDEQGALLTWRDGTWSAPQSADTSIAGYDDVSCVSPTYCLAVNGEGGFDNPSRIVRWDGTRWRVEAELDGWVQAIWCGSVGSCVATGYASYRLSGGTWRPAAIGSSESGEFGGDDVSCVSAQWCLSVDEISGEYAVLDGTTWTIASIPGDGIRPIAVDCFAERSCVVVHEDLWGDQWTVLRLSGTSWSSHTLPGRAGRPEAVSCASDGTCTVVGAETTALAGGFDGTAGTAVTIRHSDGVWGSASTQLGGALSGVSCPAPGVCRAVGTKLEASRVVDGRLVDRNYGYAVHQDGGSWGAPVGIDPDRYSYVAELSCVSSTFCMNSAGSVFDGTSWTAPRTINPYGQGMETRWGWVSNTPEISCASPTSCVAVGIEYDNRDDINLHRTWESRWDGSSWTAPRTLPLMSVSDLDCPSATRCLVVGDVDGAGAVMGLDGPVWGPLSHLPGTGSATSVSCATPTSCAVTRPDGVTVLAGGTWTHEALAPEGAHDVSCPATDFCVVTALDDTAEVAVSVFDGTAWSPLRRLDPYDGPGHPWVSVHCPTTTFCTASQTSMNGFDSGAGWAYVDGSWSDAGLAGTGEYKWPVEASCVSRDWCLASTPWGGTTVGRRR